jgi:hypothetical protein
MKEADKKYLVVYGKSGWRVFNTETKEEDHYGSRAVALVRLTELETNG